MFRRHLPAVARLFRHAHAAQLEIEFIVDR